MNLTFRNIALCLLAFLFAGPTIAVAEQRRPNVVFFLLDDLGWKDLGCYGSDFYETPHIDAFAKQSVRFTQAYATCHVCSPTRASIMTGKYPARLDMTDWLSGRREFPFQQLLNAEIHQYLPLSEVTVAEALKTAGYATAHIGKWHLGEEPHGPTAQGFDLQIPRWNKGWPRRGYHAPFGLEGLDDEPGQYLTDRLTDEALKFIESKKDEPFFLYMSHYAVHDPIHGRKDLVEKYQQKLAGMKRSKGPAFILEGNPDDPVPLAGLIDTPEFAPFSVLPHRTVKIKQHQDNVEFAAMVETVDESLGRIRDKLESLGLSENTIVILFSDNGGMSAGNFGNPKRVINPNALDAAYSTSNLPLRGAKGFLYEGGIREPMIVHWPGHHKQGYVCDVPVVSTDFYPTILEMVGLEAMPEQHPDGLSITSLVQGGKSIERDGIYWHFPHYSNHGMQSPGGAIRVDDWKLLEYYENGTVQLFNLKNDLGERKDLALRHPEKAAELRQQLHAWRERVGANMMPPNPDYQAP
ncbi:MAG: sulfatase [Planctomycetota bacterium]|nr:sulfatase [Planctomycetota bacterium]